MDFSIAPYLIPALPGRDGGTATKLSVYSQYEGSLDGTATFSWALYDGDGNRLLGGKAPLTADQYNGWGSGSDASYIPGCIAANLGLTLAP